MGKPYDKRVNVDIIRATTMVIEGMSYQAIADVMGKSTEQIQGKVKCGLRRIGMNLDEARRDVRIACELLKET